MLEHIGIAVRNPKPVLELYSQLLGINRYKQEGVASEGIQTHFLSTGNAKLELLEALDAESNVARFLERRGEGLHHLAFEVPDIDAAFGRARDAGYQVLSEAPFAGADGKRVFFIHPKQTHGVLIECCQQADYPFDEVRVPFGDGSLAAYVAGNPAHPNVVLLHGAAGCTTLETAPLLHRLAEHYHVAGLDFSGHGQSDTVEEPFSNELFVRNLEATLDHLEWERTHLFGFSMGGGVALEAIFLITERLGRVAVHATNIQWSQRQVNAMLRRLRGGLIPAATRRALSSHHRHLSRLFEKSRAYIERLPGHQARWHERLPHAERSILVSTHDRDGLFPLDAALHLHDIVPEAHLAILPGRRHALPDLDLEAYLPVLQSHFSS